MSSRKRRRRLHPFANHPAKVKESGIDDTESTSVQEAGESRSSSPFLPHVSGGSFRLLLLSAILLVRFHAVSISSFSHSHSMEAEPGDNGENPFACDVRDHRFTKDANLRKHVQALHSGAVFKCPQPGCEYSSSWKVNVMKHFNGFHGTAGSFACDHPGCTFRSTWHGNIVRHKQQGHSDAKPFACDHNGCGFRSKTRSDLSRHKKAVHLKIRHKRCHVCEKGFHSKNHLTAHMAHHEGDGHEVGNCEECSVNLRSKSSRKPAAAKLFPCDHQGCDYKSQWRRSTVSHQKQVHSDEKPFSCSFTGCSFRCKRKTNLTTHMNQVHLKVKTKGCHVCDEQFFSKTGLRFHMMSNHQTEDHDVDTCNDCVTNLKKNQIMSQAVVASRKRKAERKRTNSTTVNKHVIPYTKRKVTGNKKVASEEAHAESGTTGSLNDDLIDIHKDMQFFSSF